MNNILKNVCSAQKLHGAEHAGSMEQREMEERNSRYRCLKMKAAAAWALAVLLSLLSVFGGEVPYVNEIQMSLAALVLLFPGNAFYAAARKQLCGNEYMRRLYPIINSAVNEILQIAHNRQKMQDTALADNRIILDFLLKRDEVGASHAMSIHMRHLINTLEEQ